MNTHDNRPLLITGGVCAILWPALSVAFYALYRIAAGRATPRRPDAWWEGCWLPADFAHDIMPMQPRKTGNRGATCQRHQV